MLLYELPNPFDISAIFMDPDGDTHKSSMSPKRNSKLIEQPLDHDVFDLEGDGEELFNNGTKSNEDDHNDDDHNDESAGDKDNDNDNTESPTNESKNIDDLLFPKKRRRTPGRSETMFPGRLHDLMETCEEKGLDHILSWIDDGSAIVVHDQEAIVPLLSTFFGQSKYRSFTRQLNMWNFKRITSGPSKGAFSHPFFVRHDRNMCANMVKTPSSSKLSSSASSSALPKQQNPSKNTGDNRRSASYPGGLSDGGGGVFDHGTVAVGQQFPPVILTREQQLQQQEQRQHDTMLLRAGWQPHLFRLDHMTSSTMPGDIHHQHSHHLHTHHQQQYPYNNNNMTSSMSLSMPNLPLSSSVGYAASSSSSFLPPHNNNNNATMMMHQSTTPFGMGMNTRMMVMEPRPLPVPQQQQRPSFTFAGSSEAVATLIQDEDGQSLLGWLKNLPPDEEEEADADE